MSRRHAERVSPETCLLCATIVEAIAAVLTVGDVRRPERAVLCRRCASLPPREQRTLRNRVMAASLARDTRA